MTVPSAYLHPRFQGQEPPGFPGRFLARQLGYGVESVRSWVRQADIDDGYTPGVSTAESARIKELEQENRELKRAIVILGGMGCSAG